VIIDGGGALHLDATTADLRLCASARDDGACLHINLAGDAATAVPLGAVAYPHAIEAAICLLGVIAAHGPDARARDVIATAGLETFRTAIADRLIDAPPPARRPPSEPIGVHPIRGGQVALGVGFAFGHTDAATLQRLVDVGQNAKVTFRASPGRALLAVGLAPDEAKAFAAAANKLGFITDLHDPRRRVVACAGAPICASGEIAARALAPQVATAAGALLGAADVIHLSGCAKGCAHQGPATIVAIGRAGRCDLLAGGAAAGTVAPADLPESIARLARVRSAPHG
jgi:precorrin-3B synthase